MRRFGGSSALALVLVLALLRTDTGSGFSRPVPTGRTFPRSCSPFFGRTRCSRSQRNARFASPLHVRARPRGWPAARNVFSVRCAGDELDYDVTEFHEEWKRAAEVNRQHRAVGPQQADGSEPGPPADDGRSAWAPVSGKKPLVILIGFLGCTPGILAKYSQIYEAEGTETVQVLPSIPSMLLAHQGWRGNGSKRVRRVSELIVRRAQDSEIIVHLFSNNGFIFFGSCMMADARVSRAVSAVILDSCPSYITREVAATGLLSALLRIDAGEAGKPGSNKKQALEAVMAPVLAALDTRQRKAWEAWEMRHPVAPHLFMYSDGDEVVSPSEVASFASAHASRLTLRGTHSLSCWCARMHAHTFVRAFARAYK
jgi:hypothetical protein